MKIYIFFINKIQDLDTLIILKKLFNDLKNYLYNFKGDLMVNLLTIQPSSIVFKFRRTCTYTALINLKMHHCTGIRKYMYLNEK